MATFNLNVSNILNLSQDIVDGSPISLSVGNTLNLVDSPVYFPTPARVGHDLSLPAPGDIDPSELPGIDDPDYDAKMAVVLASHSLRHSVSLQRSITNLSLLDILQFSQEMANVIELTVSHQLELSHELRDDVRDENIEDVIVFGSVAIAVVGPHVIDTLSFVDLAVGNVVHTITVTDNLSLVASATSFFGSLPNQSTCDVQPQAGSVTFTFPFLSPSLTVTLRTPDLGNADALNFRRVNRRDRGGSLEIFRRDIWPKHKRQRLQFSALTQDQRLQLFQIMNESLGQDIGYLDHEGRQWKGIFTTPASKVQELGRLCDNEITLEFQGELQ